MLYPHGLHVLLTGASGVDKTFFAELMHCFACKHTIGSPPPLVYFNCADMLDNPELLSSHLFGHHKGHLPGQARIKRDWWSKLTEVIYFWMKCIASRTKDKRSSFLFSIKVNNRPLGSSGPTYSISVCLICATTESVNSALLRTFQRRIQVCIDLPVFARLRFRSKPSIDCSLLQRESRKSQRTISLDKTLFGILLLGTGRQYRPA